MQMHETPVVGIDIGSTTTRVVVCTGDAHGHPTIIGVGSAKTKGVTKGFITSIPDVSESIKQAIVQAETQCSLPITGVYLGIGGIGLDDYREYAEISIRGDEVSDETISECITHAREKVRAAVKNRTIIHEIPINYVLDGAPSLGSPIGLKGNTFGVLVLFITILETHLADAISAIEHVGIDVLDTIAAPIASSLVSTSQTQKRAGCIVVNLGSETTSTIMFEHGNPQKVFVIDAGSQSITDAIALSVKTSLEDADRLKKNAGSQLVQHRTKVVGALQKQVKYILGRIREKITEQNKHLVLPAGVLFTGGGARTPELSMLAKTALQMPVSIVQWKEQNPQHNDQSLTVAYGAATYGVLHEQEHSKSFFSRLARMFFSSLRHIIP